ncbi:Ig-like domain-containing protein [Flavobacterium terrisoli]|uniref:Ig-like domain-containing protein n=1 Tax=Flavobacterium terrisoli TaxID=3242195 RepID=UPI002543A42F|nr:gliding motility-associated C-terminal domain-containing protein [Flavobacterium buctense]
MELNFTPNKRLRLSCFVICVMVFGFLQRLEAQSLPVYATTITSQDNVDFSANATDGDLSTRARIRASSGIAIGIGAYSGHLELKFDSVLPANTTSYFKIQTDDNILPSLLGGSLGGLLADVGGVLLIGNQEFTVEAKNGSTSVLLGHSQIINDFAFQRLKIVVNANNEYFIALTPSQSYDRIRLTNRVGSLIGLGNTKRLDVYEAFYIGTPDTCGLASYTSYSGSGLNLDLLGLGGAGVSNPQHVLDANTSNYSRLSLGILAVAASVEQTVYYDGLSQPTDQFFIRMKVDPSLLALGVANNIQIMAENGPTHVMTVNLNSLLNLDLLTLLQGNQIATIPFSPNAPANRITVRYNSLLNVQLTQSLDLFEIYRAPAAPTITDLFTQNPTICSGSTASLVAETGAGTELNWYSQATGGASLATSNSGQPFVTPVLTQNTSYYVSAKRIGCPEESRRIKVTVTVINLPVAADITIPDTLEACNGVIVLSPSSSIGGATFRYYKDQLKTQEITTGFSGDPGVTYVLNNTNGELSISGLTAINSPYSYYISLTVNGVCENAANTLKLVTVNYATALSLDVSPTIEGCGSVNLRDAILNYDSSSDIVYSFFDSTNTPITPDAAANIQTSGLYHIQSTSLSGSCSSLVEPVNVVVNPEVNLVVTNVNNVINIGGSVTFSATSNAPITWYDSDGNALASNVAGPFSTPGYYTFTAVSGNGNCFASRNAFVAVIDPANCPVLTERKYADSQSWGSIITGGVFNGSNAIDEDVQSHSTIVTGLGLLGIGTTWQTLQWDDVIPAGTPVNVKLGSDYSGLVALGAYSIVGTKRNGSGVPIDIGFIQPISGSLVDLLAGENVFEYTFVPSDINGPQDYDGIRIIVGSVASVAQNVDVYEAYYDKEVSQITCNPSDIEDVFYGAYDLGVGVATATVGVDDPYDAVDNSMNSYATMYSGVGILAAADLTVSFNTPTLAGDTLEILMSKPATVLSLSLLSGFTLQMYMGNTPVGLPLDNTSSLLSLALISGDVYSLVLHPQTMPYDRISIRFGGTVDVLDFLRIHDVNRRADTSVIGADATNTLDVCPNQVVQLSITPEDCATFIWYDAPTGGNVVSTGLSFTVPSNLAPGTYNYYVQPFRFGCEVYDRGIVTLNVGTTAPEDAITQVLINGAANIDICSETGTIALQAELNSTMTITNPIFHWYYLNGTTVEPIAGETASLLTLTGLTPGTYTYYVGLSSDEFCETAEDDRKVITFTILPFSVASDITADDASICNNEAAVIVPTTAHLNPQFFWYLGNDTTQPIMDGAVIGGVTFAVAANGTLTATGLSNANSPYTYYVAMQSDNTCLNLAGTLKPVIITVNDPGTPTTNNANQAFCLVDAPTVADLQVNESNVVWYSGPNGGTQLLPTDALVNGTVYYAALVDATTGCESTVRLAVNVTVSDPGTPTTINPNQTFCLVDDPKIASLQINESNVIWYANATGGSPLSPTTVLVSGTTYYAALLDATTGCESANRLAINVTISDPGTPTTNNVNQPFCLEDAPTVGNLQVNETNVVWYALPTGGLPLATTDALVNGNIYYAGLTDATTGCESAVRLAINVTVSDPGTPTTTNPNQTFCLVNAPTIANLQVNEINVVWYDASTNGTQLATTDALVNGATYYAALVDAITSCESAVRLAVNVTVSDPGTPTTTNAVQTFCLANAPTIANLQVNESNVVWYSGPNGGSPLASTTALVDGNIYYAAILDATTGCESAVRLAVSATLSSPGTPTTSNANQTFCLEDAPTVANLQVNESNVIWYANATGGSPLASITALANGNIYYAALVDAASGCESAIRLAVNATVSDPGTPTTNNTTQAFCLVDAPTIANLQVNESNVIWYANVTGGSPLASTTALVNGTTYYAALVDATTACESAIRLAISVTFSGSGLAAIQGDNDTCVWDQATYTTNAGMTNYVWSVVNGSIVSGGQTTDNFVTISWLSIGPGNVSVSYADSCSGNNNASFDLNVRTCSDITINKEVDNPTPSIDDNVTFTITVNNVGMGQFLNVIVHENLPTGYSYVSFTATAGTYNNLTGIWNIPVLPANTTAVLTVTVTVLSTGNYLNIATIDISDPVDSDGTNNSDDGEVLPICLVVYNEFSPNNDGANDTFIIDCIESYPNNKLSVYNRYGSLVYDKKRYSNDWDGTANVSGAINRDDKLPTGTYYYILDIGDNSPVKTGWLAITR